MEPSRLDWLGSFINYLILLYIFIKSIQMGTLNIFDMSVSLAGIIVSIAILINNNILNKGEIK